MQNCPLSLPSAQALILIYGLNDNSDEIRQVKNTVTAMTVFDRARGTKAVKCPLRPPGG